MSVNSGTSRHEIDERLLPPEWVRAAVSFCVFVHLFVIVVGVLANWNPSRLSIDLRERVPLVKPYLQYLAMDQSYVPPYGLTFDTPEDTDMTVEMELDLADGTRQDLSLPASGLWPGQRWRREARLAETACDIAAERSRNLESMLPQGLESVLAQAIAAHYVSHYGATGGVLRCRRHHQQRMDELASVDPATRDPYAPSRYATLYEARIILVGGQVQLLKTEAAAEVAPAAVNENTP